MPTARAGSPATTDPISQFFADLAAQGHLATFEGDSATLRFEVRDGGQVHHWYVAVSDGDVAVSRQNKTADAVVRVARPQFEAIVTGRLNAQAALLRGVAGCEGSLAALMMFQRALPGPPGSAGRVAPISSRQVTAERTPA